MQDDIEDRTRWLIEHGIAAPDRIGIHGASCGGYAAMMALVPTPDLLRAGATFAGVSDLLMLIDDDGGTTPRRSTSRHSVANGMIASVCVSSRRRRTPMRSALPC